MATYKKVSDLFQALPEEVRDRAFKNMRSQYGEEAENEEAANLANALEGAFTWSHTDEGYSYWAMHHSMAESYQKKALTTTD